MILLFVRSGRALKSSKSVAKVIAEKALGPIASFQGAFADVFDFFVGRWWKPALDAFDTSVRSRHGSP